MNKKFILQVSFSVALVGYFSGVVSADDIYPPDYAGLDNSAVVFWEEETEGLGDLFLVDFDVFEFDFPLSDYDGGAGPGEPALDIVSTTGGEEWIFFMPNFVDPLPLKLIRIQVTFSGPEPSIDEVVGVDPLPVDTTGPLSHFHDIPLNPVAEDYYFEDWELRPNPDYEFVTIFVPDTAILHQVVIDTISIPEPSTLLLASLGFVGFLGRRRRV